MKVLEINEVPYGSTGGIVYGIANAAKDKGIKIDVAVGYSRHHVVEQGIKTIRIGGFFNKSFHMLMNMIFGIQGIYSTISTLQLIKHCEKIDYSIIHLHNVHGCFINFPLFFFYLKKKNIPIVWTLHDCWAFTGGCPHFIMNKCDKWKRDCKKCKRKRDRFDNFLPLERVNYLLKKRCFSEIRNLTIVTPSTWLRNMLSLSFLKDYKAVTINNGIDTSVFHKIDSDIRKRLNIENKYIILGVAMGWTKNKGIDSFIQLARDLDDERYKIILVGEVYKKYSIPSNIIHIPQTENREELVKLYSAADLFVNPSYEESFSLVNVEALACGTPVVTYEAGGAGESIDKNVGCVIKTGNYKELLSVINRISDQKGVFESACIEKAPKYEKQLMFRKYIDLYFKIIERERNEGKTCFS